MVEIETAEACLALATASAREFEVTRLESSAAMTAQTQGTDICHIYVVYKWYVCVCMCVSFMNEMWNVREFEVTRLESSAAFAKVNVLCRWCVIHEWDVDIYRSCNDG